jgi:predicted RNA-binding protein
MSYYICNVSPRFPKNYEIGMSARKWGVEEKYENRIRNVTPGDLLIFVVNRRFKSIHEIKSSYYREETPLWPIKDKDIFPYRIDISAPIFVGDVLVPHLADEISFMKGKKWGGTLQGAAGVFNDRLTHEDFDLIKRRMRKI